MSALDASARRLLEDEMQSRNYEYQSDFARRFVVEGKAEEARSAIVRVLTKRSFVVTDEVRRRIEAETDLERWLDLAIVTTSLGDVFGDS